MPCVLNPAQAQVKHAHEMVCVSVQGNTIATGSRPMVTLLDVRQPQPVLCLTNPEPYQGVRSVHLDGTQLMFGTYVGGWCMRPATRCIQGQRQAVFLRRASAVLHEPARLRSILPCSALSPQDGQGMARPQLDVQVPKQLQKPQCVYPPPPFCSIIETFSKAPMCSIRATQRRGTTAAPGCLCVAGPLRLGSRAATWGCGADHLASASTTARLRCSTW